MPAKDTFESRPFKPSADRLAPPEPTIVYTTEVREPGTVAAWWVGGLVVIVAILSATYIVTRNPNTDKQVANAVSQARLQGALDRTQFPVDGRNAEAPRAQTAANAAPADTDRSAPQAADSIENANTASARVADPSSAGSPAFAIREQ